MNKINIFKFKNSQAGVSLIISFFIMIIILAIIVSITTLLYKEIKTIRNIGNSVVAFYAADSGIEKIMYYDRKAIPDVEGVGRGLCSMFSYDPETNPNSCPSNLEDLDMDEGLYCNENGAVFLTLADPEDLDGCDADVCDNCIISFFTDRENGDDPTKSYEVVARIIPNEDPEAYSSLRIGSTGFYKGLNRKIELDLTRIEEGEAIIINPAFATPESTEYGTSIEITAVITSLNGISTATAHIKTSPSGSDVGTAELIRISGDENFGTYRGTWTGPVNSYYVDIIAVDAEENEETKQLY